MSGTVPSLLSPEPCRTDTVPAPCGTSVPPGNLRSGMNNSHQVPEQLCSSDGCWLNTPMTSGMQVGVGSRCPRGVRVGPVPVPGGWLELEAASAYPTPHSTSGSLYLWENQQVFGGDLKFQKMHLVASSLITTICLPGSVARPPPVPPGMLSPGVCNNREPRSKVSLSG